MDKKVARWSLRFTIYAAFCGFFAIKGRAYHGGSSVHHSAGAVDPASPNVRKYQTKPKSPLESAPAERQSFGQSRFSGDCG